MLTKTILITALIGALASPAFAATKKHSRNASWDVFVNGQYVGSDPDALIRDQLRRDGGSAE